MSQEAAQSEEEISTETLANMEYQNEFTESGTAPLENGEYREQAAPGSATETKVMLTDYVAAGELNGQPSIAVVLVTDPGGSGTFYTLHVVQEVDGQPTDVAATLLGDRVQINGITIENNQIIVDMITFAPDDPMCCPTQEVIQTYELQDGELVLTSTEVVGTVEGEEAADTFALDPSQISLDTGDLPYSWQPVVIEGTLYDASMPPGPVGLPTHIEILFGVTDPADRQPGSPIMYIIPANPYRNLWDDAGNDAVTRTMQEIQQLNFMLVTQATSGYPALPFEEIGGVNDLAVQVGKAVSQAELNTTSATQDGYRFVGRWAQSPDPITNQNLRYTYQGFTNDGVYLVTLWWPELTSVLPNDVSEVSAEQMDAFNADPTGATAVAAEELNTLSADQWEPDLTALDALIASLKIEGMPASGLVDRTWEWTEGPIQPDSSEIVTIDDPFQYQVIYGSDGAITYKADCNSGSMSYELNNAGMTGDMLASPGIMTLAECGPESFSNAFIASLEAAQTYQVWAGGNEMQLVLPAGGGVLTFRAADASDMPSAEETAVSGMVTNVESNPIPEGAVATIQIQDTSLAGAPATVIGEQIIENPGQFPIAYQVAYDPSVIEDNHTYTMSTRITGGDGNLLFINDTAIPVITNGNPTENVEIPVIQVSG